MATECTQMTVSSAPFDFPDSRMSGFITNAVACKNSGCHPSQPTAVGLPLMREPRWHSVLWLERKSSRLYRRCLLLWRWASRLQMCSRVALQTRRAIDWFASSLAPTFRISSPPVAVQRSRAICSWRSWGESHGRKFTCFCGARDSTALQKEPQR